MCLIESPSTPRFPCISGILPQTPDRIPDAGTAAVRIG